MGCWFTVVLHGRFAGMGVLQHNHPGLCRSFCYNRCANQYACTTPCIQQGVGAGFLLGKPTAGGEGQMDETTSFGAWLQRRRRAHDLTQTELAAQVGCSLGTIRHLEQDERRPSKQLAELLAVALTIPEAERVRFLQVVRGTRDVEQLASSAAPLAIATDVPD